MTIFLKALKIDIVNKTFLPGGGFLIFMVDQEPKNRRHYSEKGGHKERREFSRLDEEFRMRFPGLSPKGLVPQPVPIDTQWIIRRSMLRDPRDGRR